MVADELMARAATCARYVRNLGARDGLATFFQTRVVPLLSPTARVRVPGSAARVTLRSGTSDIDVFDQVFVRHDYDARNLPQWRALQCKYEEILRRGKRPVIVDCGANIGLASLFFDSIFPKAAVVAVEPEPGNFVMLQRNCAELSHITPVHAAVSDRAGTMRVANPGANNWAFQFERVDGAEEGSIKAITVSDAVAVVPNGDVLIVKVDIEGAEEQLFRAAGWASTAPLIIVELHDWMKPWAGSSHSFLKAIAEGRFDFAPMGANVFAFNWDALREFATEAAA